MHQTTTQAKTSNLVEVRCTGTYYDRKLGEYQRCNKLLALVENGAGYQIKCQRCGTINEKGKTNG